MEFPPRQEIEDFAEFGVRAFTTTRAAGSFGLQSEEPVALVMSRWYGLRDALASLGARFATASQVHGNRVVVHQGAWEGWLRVTGADGHAAPGRLTAMAVTVADCVPIFIAHASGAAAILHCGWRGTAAGILDRGIALLSSLGVEKSELRIHFGPAICGACYEVSADVYAQLAGRTVDGPTTVDLRALLAQRARTLGVAHTVSDACTKCDNDRFFSHRAGDVGRQLGVIVAL
ncbi:MAG: polyphenol oxidase family protein [Gemmatimonadaceae bacterium]